ncbi:WD40 repeat domain-containing protein [cf. Phormidesmis sp. LEGE 11477]|uniref:WD40 repeat domain-containing protein n=1 Tax=cf. Phormidesmis sp. LEGE 11477 TaxID=1828680 RepID=UPI001880A7DD|nr:WD40 repeat domain-containing protein [cf. Phormidesmis sp. LEGE 11477]MBE9064399.1 WD40 repeat domain-containing protein [cf. Phormidesmis sp. LEGE 11477]
MAPKNRNLFPFFAVLISAGVVASLGGTFLWISDWSGGDGRVISPLEMQDQASTQSSAVRTIGSHAATVLSVAAEATSPLIASGSYDSTVKLWNRNDAEVARSLAHEGRVNDLVFTTDGQQLITGSGSGDVNLWRLPSADLIATLPGNAGRIMSVATSLDNTTLAVGSGNGAIKTWALDEILSSTRGNALASESELPGASTLNAIGPQINAIAFHPVNPNLLVSGDQAGAIRIWDVAQRQNTRTLTASASEEAGEENSKENSAERILSLAVNSRGYIASGSADASIRIWNLENAQLTQTLRGHDLVVADVAFSPDGTLLASASYDETIKIWDWQKNEVLCTLNGHSGFVYSVAFSDAGDTLISGGYDGTVRSWDLVTVAGGNCLAY